MKADIIIPIIISFIVTVLLSGFIGYMRSCNSDVHEDYINRCGYLVSMDFDKLTYSQREELMWCKTSKEMTE